MHEFAPNGHRYAHDNVHPSVRRRRSPRRARSGVGQAAAEGVGELHVDLAEPGVAQRVLVSGRSDRPVCARHRGSSAVVGAAADDVDADLAAGPQDAGQLGGRRPPCRQSIARCLAVSDGPTVASTHIAAHNNIARPSEPDDDPVINEHFEPLIGQQRQQLAAPVGGSVVSVELVEYPSGITPRYVACQAPP
jgi:hypothetical protein